MRNLILGLCAAASLAAVAAAQTPVRTPADLVHARQASYKQILGAFKGVSDQLRASEPALPVIRQNSAILARLTPQVSGWFPVGTGPEAGVRTRAKAEIWSNPQGFRTAAVNLVVAARGLDAAARGSDIAAIRAAFTPLRESCSACHDQFRGPEGQ